MSIDRSFEVSSTADRVFATLLDLDRVVSCFPGATVTPDVHGTAHGRLRLRIDGELMAYDGSVTLDHTAHDRREVELLVEGASAQAQAPYELRIAGSVEDAGGGNSRVRLSIRGGPDASVAGSLGGHTARRLLEQFARNLDAVAGAGDGSGVATAQPAATPGASAMLAQTARTDEAPTAGQTLAAGRAWLLPVSAIGAFGLIALAFVWWTNRRGSPLAAVPRRLWPGRREPL